MQDSYDDVSNIHRRYTLTLINPSSKIHSLVLSLIVTTLLVATVVFGYLKSDDFVVRLAAVLVILASTQYLDSRYSKNKEYYYKINVQGTKNLIDSCKKNKVKRIIFVSSMASTKDYLDDYGKSKKEAEDLIKNSGLDYTILRPSFIYGKNSNSMKKMISFINSFKFIPIVGNGEYTLNPVHVDDVVKAIISCINSRKSIKKTYDILGRNEISFNEFINVISEKYNIQKRKIHIPIPICLVISSVGSILGPSFPLKKSFVLSLESKYKGTIASAERDLNYSPISFKEGLNK